MHKNALVKVERRLEDQDRRILKRRVHVRRAVSKIPKNFKRLTHIRRVRRSRRYHDRRVKICDES